MVFNTFMFLWLLWLHIHVFVSLVSHPLWFTFCNSFTIPTQVDFLKTITNSFQIQTSNEHKYGIWFKVITNLVDKREQITTFQYRKKLQHTNNVRECHTAHTHEQTIHQKPLIMALELWNSTFADFIFPSTLWQHILTLWSLCWYCKFPIHGRNHTFTTYTNNSYNTKTKPWWQHNSLKF